MTSIFSKEKNRVVVGKPPRLDLLQALMAGSVPFSVLVCRDYYLRSTSRRMMGWPQWMRDLSESDLNDNPRQDMEY